MKTIYIVLRHHGVFQLKASSEDCDNLMNVFPGEGPVTIIGIKREGTHVELKFLLEEVVALEVTLS